MYPYFSHLSSRSRSIVLAFLSVLLFASIHTLTTRAYTLTCPSGTAHLASAQEAAAAPGGGIVAGVTYVCPSDASLGVSNAAGSAKQYLISLPKQTLSSCAPPDQQNIDKLNNSFAICAANFLKAYSQRYGGVVITSAFRDNTPGSAPNGSGQSANACAGGATNSNHAKGLAIDVHPTGTDGNHTAADLAAYRQLWDFASQNPQFGVCFPFQNHPLTGYPQGDWPHMILAGIGGVEGSDCAAQGVTQACSGSNFNPNTITTTTISPQPQTPTTQICGLLGISACAQQNQPSLNSPYYCVTSLDPIVVMPSYSPPGIGCYNYNPQSQQSCPPGYLFSAMYSSCVPQQQMMPQAQPSAYTPSQSPVGGTAGTTGTAGSAGTTQICVPSYSCANGVVMYHSTACVASTYKLCNYGCNSDATDCAATSSTSQITGTSSSDQIISLLNAPQNQSNPSPSATATPIMLNPSVTNIVQIVAPPAPPSNTGSTVQVDPVIGATSTMTIQPTNAPQTFTSNDLQNTSATNAQQDTTLGGANSLTILHNLQNVLSWIISYLQPFHGNVPSVGD